MKKHKTLTYWIARTLHDSSAYNLRADTKREVVTLLKEFPAGTYGPVEKVSITYANPLDLVKASLGEGGGFWEY